MSLWHPHQCVSVCLCVSLCVYLSASLCWNPWFYRHIFPPYPKFHRHISESKISDVDRKLDSLSEILLSLRSEILLSLMSEILLSLMCLWHYGSNLTYDPPNKKGFEAITGTIANGILFPSEIELRPQVHTHTHTRTHTQTRTHTLSHTHTHTLKQARIHTGFFTFLLLLHQK